MDECHSGQGWPSHSGCSRTSLADSPEHDDPQAPAAADVELMLQTLPVAASKRDTSQRDSCSSMVVSRDTICAGQHDQLRKGGGPICLEGQGDLVNRLVIRIQG